MSSNTFVRKSARLTKERAKGLVATGLQRAAAKHGKDELALAAGCSARCIEKALALDTLPSIETLFNALSADPTILDEFVNAYGLALRPAQSNAANDLNTAAGLSHAAGALIEAHQDGRRCHVETMQIADRLRPLVPQISAIIEEADRLRGAA